MFSDLFEHLKADHMSSDHQNRPRYDRMAKWAGICLLIGVPLTYAHNGHQIVLWSKLLVAQAIVLFMGVAWIICALQNQRSADFSLLDLAVVSYLALSAISWFSAINPFKSGLEVVKLLTVVVLYFAVSRTFQKAYLLSWMYVITVVSAIISFIGINQYFGTGFLWLRTVGFPSATFIKQNFAAMYLIMVIPLATLPFLFARQLKAEIGWGILATLPVIFLIYTRTRGAWVGLSAALVLTLLVLK